MDPALQSLEVLSAPRRADDDLPVEHEPAGREAQLGEVPAKRLAVSRLHVDVVAVDEDDGPEAVELGLVQPALTLGQLGRRARELREQGRLERKGHAGSLRQAGGASRCSHKASLGCSDDGIDRL